MVRWYHLILTAYGFWLPNDPRGSWSEFVGSWELRKFGAATKTNDKRSLANVAHDRQARLAAKRTLKNPPVRFSDAQRTCIGDGFAQAVFEGKYLIHACCIGHDHAHLVVARHTRSIERIASHLKSKATMSMTRAGVHPLKACCTSDQSLPSPWAEGAWSVFVNDPRQLQASIAYVQRHPVKEGLALEEWRFTVEPGELLEARP